MNVGGWASLTLNHIDISFHTMRALSGLVEEGGLYLIFEQKFLDDIRDAMPLRGVIGRRTKLERSGHQWKACCPFHGEKTPSFYIYDDHFHCYGCGAHGDVFSFLMQSEGLSFPDAVAALAAEAGMELPKADPKQVVLAEETARLRDILQEAATVYRDTLFRSDGRAAQTYLKNRGVTDETAAHFGLGWASSDHQALMSRLKHRGFSMDEIMKSGLIRSESGGAAFFSRVMFPIHDRRGNIISFGGRTLGDAQPKYVNGAETLLFSKKRTLYNLHNARVAVRKDKEDLLVVEGYTDVIALTQAGFATAIAPLGTAITVEQLDLMWRESSAPIICLDGDAAGSRAALRVAEIALPLISAEKTLRFCRLPEGDDPDSLIKSQGPEAMRAQIAHAQPLLNMIFSLLRSQCDARVPEQRAGLRHRLDALAATIADRTLGYEYRRSWRDAAYESFRVAPRISRDQVRIRRADNSSNRIAFSAKHGHALQARAMTGDADRLNILTTMILTHPELLDDVEQAYGALQLPPDLSALRNALSDWSAERSNVTGLGAGGPLAWFEAEGETDETMARCAQLARGLQSRYGAPTRQGNKDEDQLLAVDMNERWWHFYGLVNLPSFEAEVMRDVAAAVADPTLKAFPEALRARLAALDRLRAGEPPDDGL